MKRYAALLPLLALLLVPTGCGSQDTFSLDPVAEAATKTVEVGSSRVEFTMTMNAAGKSFDMTGSGLFDYRNPRGELTYHMTIPGIGNVRMDIRMVGTKMFMRMPAELAGGGLPNGREWIAFDLGKSLKQAGLGSLDFTQQGDPAQTLQYLQAASNDVHAAGSADIKGTSTTRYVGRLDFRKALDAGLGRLKLSDAQRKQARKGMQTMLDQVGSKTLPFEVFIDRDGLLRRMKMVMNMRVAGDQVVMKMQTDYSDFGVAVDVQAPPASSVLDVTGKLQP